MDRHEFYDAIRQIPIVDVHSHLLPQDACADLPAVLFYHMIQYPLRAAGVDERQLWSEPGNFHSQLEAYEQLCRHWPQVSVTSFGWMLRAILRELYEFDSPLTRENLPALVARHEKVASRRDWQKEVLAKAGITVILTSRQPSGGAPGDGLFSLTNESSPLATPRQHVPWSQRLRKFAERSGIEISCLADLAAAIDKHYAGLDWTGKNVLVAWISCECDFAPVADADIDAAIRACTAGAEPDRAQQGVLSGAIVRCICRAITGRANIFQIVYGTDFVTGGYPHPVSYSSGRFASALARLIGEFPEIHFDILSGCEVDEQTLCSLCLGYPNVSLSGFWWGSFYGSIMHSAWQRRLDMVPAAKLSGFFSDAWCAEWAFARARMTQRVLVNVLWERIDRGMCSLDEALATAQAILHDSPKAMFVSSTT